MFSLATAILRHRPLTAWFWPHVAPVWPLPAAPALSLRTLLMTLTTLEGAPASVPAFVALLARHVALEPVLDTLRPDDGALLLQATTGGKRPSSSTSETSSPSKAVVAAMSIIARSPLRAALLRQAGRWPADDNRLVWLAAVAGAGGSPARLANPEALADAVRLTETLTTIQSAGHKTGGAGSSEKATPGSHVEMPMAPGGDPSHAGPGVAQSNGSAGQQASRASDAGAKPPFAGSPADTAYVMATPRFAEAPPDSPDSSQHSLDPDDGGSHESPPELVASDYAGLFYALNVLTQLGFEAWLTAHPGLIQLDFCFRLLRRIGEDTGMAPDDVALAWMPALEGDVDLKLAEELEASLAHWADVCERHCREQTGLSLAELVRRRGRLLVTRTHLDAYFNLSDAEIRIRRAGFDINPGWLPWFGRVVSFWYLAEGESL